MSQTPPDERRQFHRIAISLGAVLHVGNAILTCRVADISLHGVLLADCDPAATPQGASVRVDVQLDDDGDTLIQMRGEAVHVQGDRIGIKCQQMELDSAVRLRRLVELNLADPQLLERELAAMIDAA